MRYELARQNKATLELKRKELIKLCEGLDTCEDNHGQTVFFGECCYSVAWNKMLEINKESGPYDGVTFENVFIDGVGIEENQTCDNCLSAYKIKYGELAKAKKEFGAAKRSLAAIGKQLINRG